MREFQRFKNEANSSIAHWDIICWRFLIIKIYEKLIELFESFHKFKYNKILHLHKSMRHRRICFIFEALDFAYWDLQYGLFEFLLYVWCDVCVRGFQLQVLDGWILKILEL